MTEVEKTRLARCLRHGPITPRRAFAHWFENGFFVLLGETKAELHHSSRWSSQPSQSHHVATAERGGAFERFAASIEAA
jgi:hypothetical protein